MTLQRFAPEAEQSERRCSPTRRTVAFSIAGWPLFEAGCAASQTQTDIPVRTAAAFMDSVGVNTHLPYTDGGYGDLTKVARALAYVGVAQIRDRAPQDGYRGQNAYTRLPELVKGLTMCLFVSGDIDKQVDTLAQLAERAPGLLSLIEGPNEINNEGAYGVAKGDHAAAQAYQARLYAAVHSRPALSATPVLNFTDYPDTAGRSDAANLHSYPKRARPPEGTLRADLARQKAVQPAGDAFITEAGYATDPGNADGVTEADQARLGLLLQAEAFALGVKRTYLYQLLDDRPSEHWGLFRSDGSPKPWATALRDLSSTLRRPVRTSQDIIFESVTGARAIQLAHPSGSRDLLVWNEQAGPVRVMVSRSTPATLSRPLADPIQLPPRREHIFESGAALALLRLS